MGCALVISALADIAFDVFPVHCELWDGISPLLLNLSNHKHIGWWSAQLKIFIIFFFRYECGEGTKIDVILDFRGNLTTFPVDGDLLKYYDIPSFLVLVPRLIKFDYPNNRPGYFVIFVIKFLVIVKDLTS